MRYLVFAGEDYYPDGGWGDFQGAYKTLSEARDQWGHGRDWMQIVDLRLRAIVLMREPWMVDWCAPDDKNDLENSYLAARGPVSRFGFTASSAGYSFTINKPSGDAL